MKSSIIIFLALLLSISISAQIDFDWDIAIGGTGNETAKSAVQTPDGGFIVVGSTDSEGSGKLDGYIVKIEANGDHDWTQTYGGKKDDEFNAIIEFNGNYAIAGSSESKGSGKKDFWLMVIDNEGNKLWEYFYGREKDEEAYDIIKSFDGNLVLAGYTKSKGPKKHNFYLMKVNATSSGKEKGKMIWHRTAGSNGTDIASKIKQNPQDSFIYALGHTTSYGAGGFDLYFVKFDSERGGAKKKKYYGGRNFEHGNDFLILPDNNFLIAGGSMSESKGFFDTYLIQIEKEYYKVWDAKQGDIEDEEIMSICRNGEGYVVGGFTSSFGEGKYDAWIAEIDNLGNVIEENTFGEEEDDKINKMIKCKDGSYLMVGYTESKGEGQKAMWIVKTK